MPARLSLTELAVTLAAMLVLMILSSRLLGGR
jgi:hypothetical protein